MILKTIKKINYKDDEKNFLTLELDCVEIKNNKKILELKKEDRRKFNEIIDIKIEWNIWKFEYRFINFNNWIKNEKLNLFEEDFQIKSLKLDKKWSFGVNDSIFFKDLDFFLWDFEDEIYFTNVIFKKSLNFVYARFNKMISFTACTFEKKLHFPGAIFEKNILFTCSFFKEWFFLNHCIFESNVDFSDSEFSNDLNLENTIFEKNLNLRGVKIENLILKNAFVRNINIGNELDIKNKDRWYFTVLKDVSLRRNDNISALNFHIKEMNKHFYDLVKNLSFSDVFLLFFEKISSYFWTIWYLPFFWIFIFWLYFYFILIWNLDIKWSEFIKFLYPVNNDFEKIFTRIPEEYILLKLYLIFYGFRILEAVLIWEMIKSFRKYYRKL